MNRREFLKLGAIAGGTFALGGISRAGRGMAAAQTGAVPTVDRLVMTNVVDNVYDGRSFSTSALPRRASSTTIARSGWSQRARMR